MPRSISLHVGINKVNEAKFSARRLLSCENDAVAMSEIAHHRQFDDVRLLRGPEATFKNIDAEIRQAAGLLTAGDIFLFTFAGHGCRVIDTEESTEEEPDSRDEALVLFDRLLLDDYLHRVLWPLFAEGVRIVGVADSCHSGTGVFAMPVIETVVVTERLTNIGPAEVNGSPDLVSVHTVEHVSVSSTVMSAEPTPLTAPDEPQLDEEVVTVSGFRPREITNAQARQHLEAEGNKEFYDGLKIPSLAAAPPVRADLLTIGACQDDDTTADGPTDGHGEFTEALLKVWNGGAFSGTYLTFLEEIGAKLPDQVPSLKPDVPPAFSAQQPFSV